MWTTVCDAIPNHYILLITAVLCVSLSLHHVSVKTLAVASGRGMGGEPIPSTHVGQSVVVTTSCRGQNLQDTDTRDGVLVADLVVRAAVRGGEDDVDLARRWKSRVRRAGDHLDHELLQN
jgi:hypothetical protein